MILYRILKAIALMVALALVGGTIYGLFIRPSLASPPGTAQPSPSSPQRPPFPQSDADLDSVFSGIGTIRAITAGDEGATVVLSIAFPYNSRDVVFSEELASHIADFRAIAQGYFRSHTLQGLKLKDEQAIKEELLLRYNQVLRLGSIRALYFSDYMIIE